MSLEILAAPVVMTRWDWAPVITSMVLLSHTVKVKYWTHQDHIVRLPQQPTSSVAPTWWFAFLRCLDPVLVGWLLLWTTTSENRVLDFDGKHRREWIFTGLIAVAAMRHVFWAVVTNMNEWNCELAWSVGLVNLWFDWTHAQCLLHRRHLNRSNLGLGVGVVLFVLGITIELVSETQRFRFKQDPVHKGKLFTGGLFRYARHINYLGYASWRFGLGLISGPPFTLAYGFYHAIDFFMRAIPLLQGHMEQKYPVQWDKYRQQTPHVLIPGLL
jgi:protein-S-isoprenylcysteine O-methyltransferase Ste14